MTTPARRPHADGPCCTACGQAIPRVEWAVAWCWTTPDGTVAAAHGPCYAVFEAIGRDPDVAAAAADHERRAADGRPYDDARPAADVIAEARARYLGDKTP